MCLLIEALAADMTKLIIGYDVKRV